MKKSISLGDTNSATYRLITDDAAVWLCHYQKYARDLRQPFTYTRHIDYG